MSNHNLTLKKIAHQSNGQPQMNMGPIHAVLGEDTPPGIEPTSVGRLRLVTALRNKYGMNYRNHPDAHQALTHFDSEHDYFKALRKIKAGGTNG